MQPQRPSISKQHSFGGIIYNDPSNDHFKSSHGIPTPDLYWRVLIRYFKKPSMFASAPPPDVMAWLLPNHARTTDVTLLNKAYSPSDPENKRGYRMSIHQLHEFLRSHGGDSMPELPPVYTELNEAPMYRYCPDSDTSRATPKPPDAVPISQLATS